MSFRAVLFLSIVAAVMAAAFLEAGLDFVANRANAFAQARVARDLERYGDSVEFQLRLNLESPALANFLVIQAPLGRDTRYRIVRNDAVLYESRPPPQQLEEQADWSGEVRHLNDGYRVELAVKATLLERFLTSDLLADLIDLPLFFVLGFLVAWLLGKIVMRPVRELTNASQQLAAQHFPEPIKVPPGNDELSRMARSFNVMTASIRGFMERERTFTRYASHELRTPLTALKAQVESAEMGLAEPEEIWPVLDRNISRMEEVLAALLALARSSEHDREEVDAWALLRETVDSLPVEQRGRVSLELGSGERTRLSDRRLAAQAVRNLLENALRYSDGPVTLSAGVAGRDVRICVSDTGQGVPEAALERLREPFFRAVDKGQGLGLGLSLVDSISRSLGGRVELRNTHPGFEAVVTIPLTDSER